jgi:hypothetical protein
MACRSLVRAAITDPALVRPALTQRRWAPAAIWVNDRAFGFDWVIRLQAGLDTWNWYRDSICSLTSVLLFQSRVRFHHFENTRLALPLASSREVSTGTYFGLRYHQACSPGAASSAPAHDAVSDRNRRPRRAARGRQALDCNGPHRHAPRCNIWIQESSSEMGMPAISTSAVPFLSATTRRLRKI